MNFLIGCISFTIFILVAFILIPLYLYYIKWCLKKINIRLYNGKNEFYGERSGKNYYEIYENDSESHSHNKHKDHKNNSRDYDTKRYDDKCHKRNRSRLNDNEDENQKQNPKETTNNNNEKGDKKTEKKK